MNRRFLAPGVLVLILTLAIVGTGALTPNGARADDKLPIPEERWDLRVLKEYGLKPGDITFKNNKVFADEVTVVLKFDKDLKASEIKLLEDLLKAKSFEFCFIDAKDTVLEKVRPDRNEGKLTGKAGDTIKLILKMPKKDIVSATKKVELRR